jgi:serine/threonine-protein kinase
VVGTPDYISPEQASGNKVDFRSDLYSLGVCLYQMMTGILPYEGTVSTVMKQHVVGELPERKPSGGREIPPEIYNIIIKLMVKDPHDRYSNITELIEDLDYYRSAEIMKEDTRNRDKSFDIKDFKIDNEMKDLKQENRLLELQSKRFFYVIIALLVAMVLETFFFIYMYG